MPPSILATKLYIPRPRPRAVPRSRLIQRLNEEAPRKLTLVSAPAGFGKTTLVSEWVQALGETFPPGAVAWLSLDEADSDPLRFLTYLVAALQTVDASIGQGALGLLQSPHPPPSEVVLAALLNDIALISQELLLILDDYHLVEAQGVDHILTFLLSHMPPAMHLVIATREDPQLPLARLRAQNQLTELRFADLRFTSAETAEFLNQTMGLHLSAVDVAAIERRTEGWIAGLQLAAISMRGRRDTAGFIESFTGSHRFILDYLLEEVLDQQTESIQTFLLRTSLLDRLTGALCDAVTGQTGGQQTLEYLERANLFLVPLDSERRWYRYHRLFADLLRHRLQHSAAVLSGDGSPDVEELHLRACTWYEGNGLDVEAFRCAAAANDVERAADLIEGGGTPLQYRGAATEVLDWLASLPAAVLDARPALWVNYASALTIVGEMPENVEEKLSAAETALAEAEPDDETRDLFGRIAAIRAMQAIPQSRADMVVEQSRLALAYLKTDNLLARTVASWTLGHGYQLQGNRAAARQVYEETIPISQASGNLIITIGAAVSLGQIQEEENQLHEAERTFRRVLELTGDPPLPFACAAHFGLARLAYEWNDLGAAEEHGQESLVLGRHLPNIDTPAACKALLARVKLARGDVPGALRLLSEAEAFARERGFAHRLPEVAAVQVLTRLRRGDLAGAASLAQTHDLPLSKARVWLAEGNPSAALSLLGPLRHQTKEKGPLAEHLRVTILQAVALQMSGDTDGALQALEGALALGRTR